MIREYQANTGRQTRGVDFDEDKCNSSPTKKLKYLAFGELI